MELLEGVIQSPQAERAFNAALSGSREGPTLLRALKKSIPKEQWGDFTSAMLSKMGQAAPGAQDAAGELFSPRTFLTNFNRLAPEAKGVLFGGASSLRRNIERLARITASLRDVEAVANPSGTGQLNIYAQWVQGGFGFAAGFSQGDTLGERLQNAAIGGTVAIGLPYGTAKLFQSERFIKWLVKGIELGGDPRISPKTQTALFNRLAAHLGRLGAIKAQEPQNAAAIDELLEGLGIAIGVAESR